MNITEIIGIILIILIIGITFYRAPAVSISYFKEAGKSTIIVFKVIGDWISDRVTEYKVRQAVNNTAMHDIDKEMGE